MSKIECRRSSNKINEKDKRKRRSTTGQTHRDFIRNISGLESAVEELGRKKKMPTDRPNKGNKHKDLNDPEVGEPLQPGGP